MVPFGEALVGFQGRGCADVIQSNCYDLFLLKALLWVAPQLTVVTNTSVRSGAAVPVKDAHAASVVPQGDRTILTRLPFLTYNVCSAAPTKTPHERRRAQVRTLGPGRVSTPVRWGR